MAFSAPKLSFGAIGRPAFGKLAQHAEEDKTPGVFTAKAKARRAMMFKEAKALLSDLPAPGEAVHAIMSGRYDLLVLLAAMLDIHPAPCRTLRIATLCFSKANAVQLLELAEGKKIGRLVLLCSSFFKEHNKQLFETFRDDLAAFPDSRVAAVRSHCKLVCFDFADETGLVIESSANLRTNSNKEQLCVLNDRALHDWYAVWLDRMVSDGQGDESRDRQTG